jgi:hypothetical protein
MDPNDHLQDEEGLVDTDPVDEILDEHHDDAHVSDEDDDIEEDIELHEIQRRSTTTTTTLYVPLRGNRHPHDLPSDLHPEPDTP